MSPKNLTNDAAEYIIAKNFLQFESFIPLCELIDKIKTSNANICFFKQHSRDVLSYVHAQDLLLLYLNQGSNADYNQFIRACWESRQVKDLNTNLLEMLSEPSCIKPIFDNHTLIGYIDHDRLSEQLYSESISTAKQLQSLSKTVEDQKRLINITSHDLRSPLGVIIASCDYLLDKNAGGQNLAPLHEDFLVRILRNAKRGTSLVSDLLDLSRIDSGLKIKLKPTQIQSYLSGILPDLQEIADQKQVTIELGSLHQIETKIDQKRFFQIIENLVNNAVKYSPKKSTIKIYSEIIQHQTEKYLEICIKDQGYGIKLPQQNKIYEDFTRGFDLNFATLQESGYGLGLSIAQQYADLHGGSVRIKSTDKSGTTFSIALPITEFEIQSSQKGSSPTILVVEDDLDIIDYLKDIFADYNYFIKFVEDGKMALSLYKTINPDLVISDLRIPNIDGFELIESIKSINPKQAIIVMSGYYGEIAEQGAGRIFNVDLILSKPFDEPTFIKALNKVCDRYNLPLPQKVRLPA